MAQVLSQCRGRTKFEQFKRGLARNDMVRAIQRCDRQMIRMFDRFMVSKTSFFSLFVLKTGVKRVPPFPGIRSGSWHPSPQAAMVLDIRFQQLITERAQSTPVSTPMSMPVPIPIPSGTHPLPTPIPTLSTPMSMSVPMPLSMPVPSVYVEEPRSMPPYPLPVPQPQVAEPSTPSSPHARQPSGASSIMSFVPRRISLPLFYPHVVLYSDYTLAPHDRKSSLDATRK